MGVNELGWWMIKSKKQLKSNSISLRGEVRVKNRDIAYMAIRILSIYTFIQACINLVYFINSTIIVGNNGISFLQMFIGFFGPFVLLLGWGILLWIFTDRICNFIVVRKEDMKDEQNRLTIESIQSIAFSIVGLIIFVKAIPQAVRIIPQVKFSMGEYALGNEQLRVKMTFQVIEKILELIIGFSLFVGGKGLVGILKKLRNLGLEQEDKE